MDVEITRLNGDSFRLSEYDVTVRDFNVGSIPVSGIYGTVEGRAGTVDYGADFGQRPITVPFYTKAYDMADYPLLRDELFALVVSQEPFYVRELRRPSEFTKCGEDNDDRYVGGKRYKVRIDGGFDLDQQFRYGFGELAFETVELPFAESIGTTADIDRDGITFESGLWGFGMGLQMDDETLKYTFGSTNFQVYNAGNAGIHPFMQDLKIIISDIKGASNGLELRNKTNGTSFKINEEVKDNQVIVLDGANVTGNDLVIDPRKTNRGLIQLNPVWNDFELFSVNSANIMFDFRFYYY